MWCSSFFFLPLHIEDSGHCSRLSGASFTVLEDQGKKCDVYKVWGFFGGVGLESRQCSVNFKTNKSSWYYRPDFGGHPLNRLNVQQRYKSAYIVDESVLKVETGSTCSASRSSHSNKYQASVCSFYWKWLMPPNISVTVDRHHLNEWISLWPTQTGVMLRESLYKWHNCRPSNYVQ